MHMEGRAEIWLHGIMTTNPLQSWHQFTEFLATRFDDLKPTNIISEFNKLSQTSYVSDYIDKFEDIRGFMYCLGRYCDNVYFVSSFIRGLKGG
ncbi:hypothetical protein LIER_33867 [Lithospermum erythrorhizon]|uniref:Retrotransposon gag domain-containing protein n=1 Tax=Lithospermum erythrorhizon TaxID=34254 RepID=A0AAV3RYR6_LITER